MSDGMIQIALQRPGRPEHHFDVRPGVYTIGSEEGNTLLLPDPAVAWRHAVLTLMGQGDWIEDLAGTGGTLVDGAPISGRVRLRDGQRITIGPYILTFQRTAPQPVFYDEAEGPPPTPPVQQPAPPPPPAPPLAAPAPAPTPGNADGDSRRAIKRQIHTELMKRLELKRLTASRIDVADLRNRVQKTIGDIVGEARARLPLHIDSNELAKEVFDEAVGLGPLEDLLADPRVTEIMVNGPEQVYIEREGRLELTGRAFLDADSVHAIVERIVAPIGRRIDESQPYVDARLPDGSRVNAIIPPLSLTGPCLTIRKFSAEPFRVDDLIKLGSFSRDMARFLEASVRLRKNIVVSGGTGSGKTTLLNVVSSYIPDTERILTIEDAAELRLSQAHVIRLEARPPNIEGRGAITIRDLVRNALRMRPDRIVVGECRGGEALDMLQAMNTGHEGSLTTVHANAPRDVISRLETMVLMSGLELPVRAIREQIGAAIHLIVHTSRYSDGSRKIARITEVVGLEGDQITMQDIFAFQQTGVDARGRVTGDFKPTGSVPTFVEDMAARGMKIDHRMFDPASWTAPS
ncbi:MAG TPA: ATPase, T2SS/T4P/T4SS family [Kiritimatiellia bacterium]|nr:ATPase, T2SS/T4P/T4SS family [Kiritimatiellia bacterium]